MKIGVNMLMAGREHSGFETYAVNIVNALANHVDDEYVVFTNHKDKMQLMLRGNIRLIEVPFEQERYWGRLVAEQFKVPVLAKKEGLDLLFTPTVCMPFFCSLPQVVTIHDMIHKSWMRDMSIKNRIFMNIFVDNSIRRADGVISVSESTLRDIEKYIGASEKVRLIYEGFREIADIDQRRPELIELNNEFALIVGAITPRKNIVSSIRAFDRIRNKTDMNLVIAGKKSSGYKEVMNCIEKYGLNDRVIAMGPMPDEELAWCYEKASMLLFCSLYEGFGLPPLEAMSKGTAVIASNVSSIPEIVGDAALLVNPNDDKAIADAILRVENDRDLRNVMIEKGYERCKIFSWDRAAAETRKVFAEMIK